jgi:hypothetical protein
MESNDSLNTSRRRFLTAAGASAATLLSSSLTAQGIGGQSDNHKHQQAAPGVTLNRSDTAVVIIDPQNDVLSEKGLAWPLLHESIKENNTIENIDRIFKAAKRMASRSLSLRTTSSQRIEVGSLMDRLKPTKLLRACLQGKAD